MYKLFTTLYDHRIKKFGFFIAGLMLLIDLLSYLLGDNIFVHYNQHTLFHDVIIIGLIMVITSRDKIDDELSKLLRYSVFKISLKFSIALIGAGAMVLSVFGIEQIPTLFVLYFFEAIMVMHILLYHFGYRYSPKWLLSEETAPDHFNRMAIRLIAGLLVCIFIVLILSVLIKIRGEA